MKFLITICLLSMSVSTFAFADPIIEIAQSVPLETSLAVPGIRSAADVWLEMIQSAQTSLDLEQFYISNQAGQPLEPILQAIEQAAARGVRVRLIADSKFYVTYPDSVNRIGHLPGAEARTIDYSNYGGVQHAKFFTIDGNLSFVGSQNFDWRALNQIHEIGLRAVDSKISSDLELIFQKDWNESQSILKPGETPSATPFFETLRASLRNSALPVQSQGDDTLTVLASPANANPAGITDSLSAIQGLIGSAQQSIQIQVMEYTTRGSGKLESAWLELDRVIRQAAARGVQVQLLVDVSDLKKAKKDLDSLASVQNIQVKSVTIPAWSGGAVDYARLIHSKYLIIDGMTSWVGSENWSEGYFMNTRDVGLLVRSSTISQQLVQVFNQVWQSSYASKL